MDDMETRSSDQKSSVGAETDPVCGMTVDTSAARGGSHTFAGHTYYFCSPNCKATFPANPPSYLHSVPTPEQPDTPPNDAVIYTCPMHSQIRQQAPGSCPICGMALEPLEVSLEEEGNPELKDMSRRF